MLRLVTGVVLLGGIGGEGLAGTRLAPPVAWVRSPADGKTVNVPRRTVIKLQLRSVSERTSFIAQPSLPLQRECTCNDSTRTCMTLHVS